MIDIEIKRLEILLRLNEARKNALKLGYEYQEYIKEHTFDLKPDEKLSRFQSFYTLLANLIKAFTLHEDVFLHSNTEWNDAIKFLNQPVEIPSRLNELYDYPDADNNLITILYRARNCQEHIDKTDQEQYKLLANSIDLQILLMALYMIDITIRNEFESLSLEERRTMIANSTLYKERIYAFQDNLKLYEPIINSGIATEGQRQVFNNALNFVPTPESLVIVDTDETPDRKE